MNCTKVQENLPLFVLGELEAPEMSAINDHLRSGCVACMTEWQGFQQTISELYEVAPTRALSVDRQTAIYADVAAKIKTSSALANRGNIIAVNMDAVPSTKRLRRGLAYLLTCVTSLLIGMIVVSESNPHRSPITRDAPPPWASLASPTLPSRVVLTSMTSSRGADFEIAATVIYDIAGGEIHFFGSELEQLPDGSRYVLWILDKRGKPLNSVRLHVDAQGNSKAVLAGLQDTRAHQGIVTIESFDGPLPLGETELSTAL